jgi:hypothetical protein
VTGGPGIGRRLVHELLDGSRGQRHSSADQEPPERLRPSQLGGIGTPALGIALVVVAAVVVVLLLS